MFSTEVLEDIIRAWEADQKFPLCQRAQLPLPDIRDVRALVETAFLTSLRQEEGRPLTFALTLLPKDTVVKNAKRRNQVLRFDKTLPLNVESVTKLAPAFDPKITSLLVSPVDEQTGNHEIWGAVIYVPLAHLFTESHFGGFMEMYRPDSAFSVTVASPGSLVISRGNSQIGRFVSGTFTKSTPTPFTEDGIGVYVRDLIHLDSIFDGRMVSDADRLTAFYFKSYISAIEFLLGEASTRGHGGTLIIIPEEKAKAGDFNQHFIKNYSFEADLQLEYLLKEYAGEVGVPGIGTRQYAIQLAFPHRLGILAQLMCIDGALILSSKLEVISFGSKLRADTWRGKVLTAPDGFRPYGIPFDTSKLGTRHNSAIDFVGQCPGTIGFVISQDGPIRGFVKEDENTIYCWPDCTASMFI